MTEENLAVIVKYDSPSDIYPSKMSSVCLTQLDQFLEKNILKKPYQIYKIKSIIPEQWCSLCNPELN